MSDLLGMKRMRRELDGRINRRKEEIQEMADLYVGMGNMINSNTKQINKNTQLIKMLLADDKIQKIVGCASPDRNDANNPTTRELCPPPQDGAGRKKRKTRKRRRKKRTKKKTRRKRRKSRKRKPKRRRKKKTRKRKAGCWPFCIGLRNQHLDYPQATTQTLGAVL